MGHAVEQHIPPLPVFADRHSLDQATFDAMNLKTRLLAHFNVSESRPIPPRGHSSREENVGLFDQAKISQCSEADVRAGNDPVHREARTEHPRYARQTLLVLDDRGAIDEEVMDDCEVIQVHSLSFSTIHVHI